MKAPMPIAPSLLRHRHSLSWAEPTRLSRHRSLTRTAGCDAKASGDPRHARSFAFGNDGFSMRKAFASRAVLDQATNPSFAHTQSLYAPTSMHHSPHYNENHHERSTNGDNDDDNLFWAAGMTMVLIGANLVALLCEINMDDKQSLLRGLGTLNKSQGAVPATETSDATEDEDGQPNGIDQLPFEGRHRRSATRIVHLKW